jgi:hypothetical protein
MLDSPLIFTAMQLDEDQKKASNCLGVSCCIIGLFLTPFIIGIPIFLFGLSMVLLPQVFLRSSGGFRKNSGSGSIDVLKTHSNAKAIWLGRKRRNLAEREAKKLAKAEAKRLKMKQAERPFDCPAVEQPKPQQPENSQPPRAPNSQIILLDREDKKLCPTKRYQ